jgi:formylmethanofuran dehydrogenase subunit D
MDLSLVYSQDYNQLQFLNLGKFVTEKMILIPGRSSKQGVTLNIGKLKEEYIEVTTTLEMNQDDMEKLGLVDGDEVRLKNQVGETIVRCLGKKPEDLPTGTLFIPYGPPSSQLMESDTAGCGMPLSKHMEVEIEKVAT